MTCKPSFAWQITNRVIEQVHLQIFSPVIWARFVHGGFFGNWSPMPITVKLPGILLDLFNEGRRDGTMREGFSLSGAPQAGMRPNLYFWESYPEFRERASLLTAFPKANPETNRVLELARFLHVFEMPLVSPSKRCYTDLQMEPSLVNKNYREGWGIAPLNTNKTPVFTNAPAKAVKTAHLPPPPPHI
jgi:hypothetical protein